jgi:hypothetical protein
MLFLIVVTKKNGISTKSKYIDNTNAIYDLSIYILINKSALKSTCLSIIY